MREELSLVLGGRNLEGHLSSQKESGETHPRPHICASMEVHQSLLLLLALETLCAGEHEEEASLQGPGDGRGGVAY